MALARQELKIVIDGHNPDLRYTSGDKITGTVTAFLPSRIRIRDFSINFKGKVKTTVTTGSNQHSHTDSSKGLLFWQHQQLISDTTVFCGEKSWPFEFEFPWEAQPVRQAKPLSASAYFHHRPGHTLPPTFSSDNGERERQSVTYYIEAVFHKPDKFIHFKSKANIALLFCPSRETLSPESKPASQSSYHGRVSWLLDPSHEKEHAGFKEKIKHPFAVVSPSPRPSGPSSPPFHPRSTARGPFPSPWALSMTRRAQLLRAVLKSFSDQSTSS